jgi:diamine N-acetyltransferase
MSDRTQPGHWRLSTADAAAVSALARVVWQATYPPLISQAQINAMLADRYAPARIAEQLDSPGQAWWGVEYQHVLVGFAHAILDEYDCKLDKLYVHPDHQQQGIGATLVQEVINWPQAQQAAACGYRSTAAIRRRFAPTKNTVSTSLSRAYSTSAAAS